MKEGRREKQSQSSDAITKSWGPKGNSERFSQKTPGEGGKDRTNIFCKSIFQNKRSAGDYLQTRPSGKEGTNSKVSSEHSGGQFREEKKTNRWGPAYYLVRLFL